MFPKDFKGIYRLQAKCSSNLAVVGLPKAQLAHLVPTKK